MQSQSHMVSLTFQNVKLKYNTFKPIFHQNAKYLASEAGVGQCPRRQNFALGIPTCWYLKCENLRFPTPNLKFALAPTPNPDASHWNIGCVGSQRKMLALAMYISCFLCRFHLRLVPNANPISGGIWALLLCIAGNETELSI